MEFLKILAENFWMSVIFMLFVITIVSIVLGIWLEAYKVRVKARQKMQELRNEELRLKLKLEQQKKDSQAPIALADIPLPKETSWGEQMQAQYDVGYQQQR